MVSTYCSHQTSPPVSPHIDTSLECLNFTFSSNNENATLWQSHSHSSYEYFQQVKYLNLAQMDDFESVVVHLPFNALSEVRLNPEPFWVEGDEIHVSHEYIHTSPHNANVVEELRFYKNFRFSNQRRRANCQSGISHNDRQLEVYVVHGRTVIMV